MSCLSIIEELEDMYLELGRLSTMDTSKLNKPRIIEWTGLIGATQDYIRERKVNQFLEKKILDTNFLNVPGFLLKKANMLVTELSVVDNPSSFESTSERVVHLTEECYSRWLSKCLGIENALIDDEIGKGVSLPLGVVTNYHLYQSFLNYPLSESTRKRIEEQFDFLKWRVNRLVEKDKSLSSSSSTGCLGIIIAAIVFCYILGSSSLI